MTCPNMMKWFEGLGVEVEPSDMSFSASMRLGKGVGFEWGSRNGVSGVLAQKSNLLSPRFWLVIREIFKFKSHALKWASSQQCFFSFIFYFLKITLSTTLNCVTYMVAEWLIASLPPFDLKVPGGPWKKPWPQRDFGAVHSVTRIFPALPGCLPCMQLTDLHIYSPLHLLIISSILPLWKNYISAADSNVCMHLVLSARWSIGLPSSPCALIFPRQSSSWGAYI